MNRSSGRRFEADSLGGKLLKYDKYRILCIEEVAELLPTFIVFVYCTIDRPALYEV